MEARHVYLVSTGDQGGEEVRCVTLSHEKAVAAAKKFVKQEDKKAAKYRKKWKGSTSAKFHAPLKQEVVVADSGDYGFGEKLTDRWSNGSRHVKITMFALDKEYTPDWYYV